MLKRSLLLCLFFAIPFTTLAEVIETHDVNEIAAAIDRETWVLLDIDETLLETARMLGSPAWKRFLLKRLDDLGVTDKTKEYVYSQITYLVIKRLTNSSVDERFPALIKKLQKQQIPVQGFTGRSRNRWSRMDKQGIDHFTHEQLLKLGIDFAQSLQPAHFSGHPQFAHGIIFSELAPKGPFLINFLKQQGYRPAKVVFVDDKRSEVTSVVTALEKAGIPCKGFLYSFAQAKSKTFDPAIAHRQLFFVEQLDVPTDDEAKMTIEKMAEKESLVAHLDSYIYLFALTYKN